MSKAFLIVDTPESCDRCSFYEDDDYCGVPGCGEYIGDYIACRPKWCPLREVPQKKEEHPKEYYEFGSIGLAFCTGYNACIDEIMKEK